MERCILVITMSEEVEYVIIVVDIVEMEEIETPMDGSRN